MNTENGEKTKFVGNDRECIKFIKSHILDHDRLGGNL